MAANLPPANVDGHVRSCSIVICLVVSGLDYAGIIQWVSFLYLNIYPKIFLRQLIHTFFGDSVAGCTETDISPSRNLNTAATSLKKLFTLLNPNTF